ncbi:MAG: signal peptidase I [Thermodesulfovibrionales bacterium]|nr:signal peptidase I [Thermodesulfovibrionales bacterium]
MGESRKAKLASPSGNKNMHLTDEFLKDLWQVFFAKNGKAWLRVTTSSMEPSIKPGELILIEKTQPESINFGDLIVFEADGLFVAHRVIKKYFSDGKLFFLQKGDKGGQAMEIPEEWLLGKVVAIEKIKGLLIRTDKGSGRYINYLFGWLSYLQFYFYNSIANRIKPISRIHCLKRFYPLFKKPFNLFHQGITSLLINVIWLRHKWR